MTSLVTERFGAPTTTRSRRVLDWARSRAVDELAGRTVWCAAALPEGREPARRLRTSLEWAGADGVAATWLEVEGDAPLRDAALRMDERLTGSGPGTAPGRDDRASYADAAPACESLVGSAVRADDVVVLHDALTAALAEAVRERGAHAVWHVRIAAAPHDAAVEAAWAFLRPFTSAVDAYVLTWEWSAPGGAVEQDIATVMPSARSGVLCATHVASDRGSAEVAWGSVLADVVEADRGESVGGMLHPRPAVAAR